MNVFFEDLLLPLTPGEVVWFTFCFLFCCRLKVEIFLVTTKIFCFGRRLFNFLWLEILFPVVLFERHMNYVMGLNAYFCLVCPAFFWRLASCWTESLMCLFSGCTDLDDQAKQKFVRFSNTVRLRYVLVLAEGCGLLADG